MCSTVRVHKKGSFTSTKFPPSIKAVLYALEARRLVKSSKKVPHKPQATAVVLVLLYSSVSLPRLSGDSQKTCLLRLSNDEKAAQNGVNFKHSSNHAWGTCESTASYRI